MQKPKGRINDWLINDEYLSQLSINSEHFKTTCKKLYTALLGLPSPIYSDWIDKSKQFYFSIGNKYCYVPYNPDISEFDFPEIVNRWAYKFYPGYEVDIQFDRPMTSDEITQKISEGADPDTVFNLKFSDKKKERFKIEKLVIRDDQINVKINKQRFILISRPDMPLSRFISNFRKITDDWERKAFVTRYTKNILEVTHYKSIEIKYTGKVLENFFKIRLGFLLNIPFQESNQEMVYKWGRFIIYFSSPEQLDRCKNIIKFYKLEYKNKFNYENYLRKEFGVVIGIK